MGGRCVEDYRKPGNPLTFVPGMISYNNLYGKPVIAYGPDYYRLPYI